MGFDTQRSEQERFLWRMKNLVAHVGRGKEAPRLVEPSSRRDGHVTSSVKRHYRRVDQHVGAECCCGATRPSIAFHDSPGAVAEGHLVTALERDRATAPPDLARDAISSVSRCRAPGRCVLPGACGCGDHMGADKRRVLDLFCPFRCHQPRGVDAARRFANAHGSRPHQVRPPRACVTIGTGLALIIDSSGRLRRSACPAARVDACDDVRRVYRPEAPSSTMACGCIAEPSHHRGHHRARRRVRSRDLPARLVRRQCRRPRW